MARYNFNEVAKFEADLEIAKASGKPYRLVLINADKSERRAFARNDKASGTIIATDYIYNPANMPQSDIQRLALLSYSTEQDDQHIRPQSGGRTSAKKAGKIEMLLKIAKHFDEDEIIKMATEEGVLTEVSKALGIEIVAI